jgi:hypothetical protein
MEIHLDHVDRERTLIGDQTPMHDAGGQLLGVCGIVGRSAGLPHRRRRPTPDQSEHDDETAARSTIQHL